MAGVSALVGAVRALSPGDSLTLNYAAALFAAAFVLFFTGIACHNQILILHSFVLTFDSLGFLNVVASAILSNFHKSFSSYGFSYGAPRWILLFSFTSGIVLQFLSAFVIKEGIEGLLGGHGHGDAHEAEDSSHDAHHASEPAASASSFIVPIALSTVSAALGLAAAYRRKLMLDNHALKTSEAEQIFLSEERTALGAHVLCWLFYWVTLIMENNGYERAPSLAAIILAVGVLSFIIPTVVTLGSLLLQATPTNSLRQLEAVLQRIRALPEVLEVHSEHLWSLRPGLNVGSLCIRIRPDADEQRVYAAASNLWHHLNHSSLSRPVYTTIQIEKSSAWT